MTSEGDIGAFLGVDIQHNSDGFLALVQTGLINKIISICGLEDEYNQHKTPSTTSLYDDDSGPDREQTWNYRSVISMLTYLSTSTRPDIAFAVHQCVRFCTKPKRSHELAIRHTVCYLKGTKHRGYILKPSSTHRNLDCFVDTCLMVLQAADRNSAQYY